MPAKLKEIVPFEIEAAEDLANQLREAVDSGRYVSGAFVLLDEEGQCRWETFGRAKRDMLWMLEVWKQRLLFDD